MMVRLHLKYVTFRVLSVILIFQGSQLSKFPLNYIIFIPCMMKGISQIRC